MRFQCNFCKAVLDLEDCQPGELVACGQCGKAVTVPATPTSPGAILGDFVIAREIGTGGMGTVFLAHQISLDRDVAVKVLLPEIAQDESFVNDFINEARMAASLNHQNVIQAYAVNSMNGVFYFAMEYVDGPTLKKILETEGAMPEARVLDIALDTASALAYAWREKQLIHRDIKPDNIMISKMGQTKLADLGLAKKLGDGGSGGENDLFATPQYVAPELMLGHKANVQSDIYSLGATIYHLLTGKYPYNADRPEDIADMHLMVPLPPLKTIVPTVSDGMCALVGSMMAKRPCQRYQNYDELLGDLEKLKNGQKPEHLPASNSQVPIDDYADDPLAPLGEAVSPGATQGRRSHKVSFKGKGNKASGEPVGTVSQAGEASQVLDEVPEAEKAGGGKGKGMVIAIAAIALILIAGGAFLFLRGGGDQEQAGDKASEAPGKAEVNFAQLDKLIAAGDKAGVLAFIGKVEDAEEREKCYVKAFPIIEGLLEEARKPGFDKFDSDWQEKAAAMKEEQERARREEEAAAAKAEEERKVKEEQARVAEEQKKIQEKFASDKEEARGQIVAAALLNNYSDITTNLADMKIAEQEQEREWADNWMALGAKAEKFYEKFRNQNKLSKTELPMPFKVKGGVWLVDEISYGYVKLYVRVDHYNEKKNRDEHKRAYDCELSLNGLSIYQWEALVTAAVNKGLLDKEEADELLCAYHIARGAVGKQVMDRIGPKLEAASMTFATQEAELLDDSPYVESLVKAVLEMKFDNGKEANEVKAAYLAWIAASYPEKVTDEVKETIKVLRKSRKK